MATYLDFNATTPVDSRVLDVVSRHMRDAFGNAGSRTHEFGRRAKDAVTSVRRLLAGSVGGATGPEGVVFTSGATEANNLAILGLREWAEGSDYRHIVTTAIEHKAVLEPVAQLGRLGFEVELVPPQRGGRVDPQAVAAAVREDTALVSVMQVNNETGVIQPLEELAQLLSDSPAFFHVDAAQGFTKVPGTIPDRADMISISGHKIFAPMGIGALLLRRRNSELPPLNPIMFGGGQERGLRPGTLPVPLIAGLGKAVELGLAEQGKRREACQVIRESFLEALSRLGFEENGNDVSSVPHTLNVSIPGVDAEAAMVLLKGIAAISNGSACTSVSYEPSHVLRAMGLTEQRLRSALRFSWSHSSGTDWIEPVVSRLGKFAS